MHDLRKIGLHARPLAGGEDDSDESASTRVVAGMLAHVGTYAPLKIKVRTRNWPAWIRTKTKWTKTTCATFTPRAKVRDA